MKKTFLLLIVSLVCTFALVQSRAQAQAQGASQILHQAPQGLDDFHQLLWLFGNGVVPTAGNIVFRETITNLRARAIYFPDNSTLETERSASFYNFDIKSVNRGPLLPAITVSSFRSHAYNTWCSIAELGGVDDFYCKGRIEGQSLVLDLVVSRLISFKPKSAVPPKVTLELRAYENHNSPQPSNALLAIQRPQADGSCVNITEASKPISSVDNVCSIFYFY